MRFKDVFSIIGPSMVGPSSSHTAGALRIGCATKQIFGIVPNHAEITLYGSFAETYRGHGTDVAVIAGLLDFATDDERISHSFAEAEKVGMTFSFKESKKATAHPNTVKIVLTAGEHEMELTGSSIGGGNVEITNVNGFDVKFSGQYPTLLIFHEDRPGMIHAVTRILTREKINIGHMDVDRQGRSGKALTVIEMDQPILEHAIERIQKLPNVDEVKIFRSEERRQS